MNERDSLKEFASYVESEAFKVYQAHLLKLDGITEAPLELPEGAVDLFTTGYWKGYQACAEQKDKEIAELNDDCERWSKETFEQHNHIQKLVDEIAELKENIARLKLDLGHTKQAWSEQFDKAEELQALKDHINKVWLDTYEGAEDATTMLAIKNRVLNLAQDRNCWLFNARVANNKLNELEKKE